MITGIFGLLSVIMVSWFLGLLMTAYLKTQPYYPAISSLNLLRSQRMYTIVGIQVFKWLVTKTVYRYLNKNIKFRTRPDLDELVNVRAAMTESEVLHGIAFLFVILAGLPVLLIQGDYQMVFYLMALNIIFNLYPTLLQQYNKAKLDKVMDELNLLRSTTNERT
jgi:hypothetical protein